MTSSIRIHFMTLGVASCLLAMVLWGSNCLAQAVEAPANKNQKAEAQERDETEEELEAKETNKTQPAEIPTVETPTIEASPLSNGDFEELKADKPIDWELPYSNASGYKYSIATGNASSGENCVLIDSTRVGISMGFGALNRVLDPTPYLGKRIRYRAAVRVEPEGNGRAQMWLRTDAKNEDGKSVMRALDNMQNRPITDPNWQHYEIVADVAEDIDEIIIGVLVIGKTRTWFDDVSIEIVEDDVVTTTLFGGDSDAPQTFFTWWLLPAAFALMLFGIGLTSGKNSSTNNAGSPPAKTVNGTQRFAFRFTLVYWLLYYFPAPLDSILATFRINIRTYCNEWLGTVVSWTGKYVLGMDVAYEVNGSGDTSYDFVRILTFFILSFVVAGIWSVADRRRADRRRAEPTWLKDGLYSYLRYALAVAMMGYGLAKLGEVMNQFQIPSSNQLNQKFGESSPMGLLWTFMGASRPYTYFAGLGEVIAGLLLVWRRTTILGAFVAIGVMTNVVVLNFCYDVPVKLFSTHLLITAVLILAPDMKRLANLFLLNRSATRRELTPPYVGPKSIWVHRLVKVALVLLCIGMPIFNHLKTETAEKVKPPAFFGDFLVDEYRDSRKTDTDETEEEKTTNRWKSVELKRYPFAMSVDGASEGVTDMLQILTAGGERAGGQFKLNENQDAFDLSEPLGGIPADFRIEIIDEDNIRLIGKSANGELLVKLRRNSREFLLMNRGFRWVNERPFNR